MEILSETLFFSILVSLFVQGMGAATNHGGILFPLKVWMENISRSKRLDRKKEEILGYKEVRRRQYQSSEWILPALQKIELLIMYRNMWHKPLLTCMVCMSSFWGTVIYWSVFNSYPLYVWLLGIPVAASITVLTHKLRS
jgi:hypothetical protein